METFETGPNLRTFVQYGRVRGEMAIRFVFPTVELHILLNLFFDCILISNDDRKNLITKNQSERLIQREDYGFVFTFFLVLSKVFLISLNFQFLTSLNLTSTISFLLSELKIVQLPSDDWKKLFLMSCFIVSRDREAKFWEFRVS